MACSCAIPGIKELHIFFVGEKRNARKEGNLLSISLVGFNALHAWIAAAVYQSLTQLAAHKEANNIAHSARGSHFGAPQSKTSLSMYKNVNAPCIYYIIYIVLDIYI